VVVCNLEPRVMRGEESAGMLLATSAGEVLSLLQPDKDIPPGSPVR
jgi:tRNA-binding EMAP/Myf-like protein